MHYFFTLIMLILFNIFSFNLYTHNYTKLHLNTKKLIWLPVHVYINLLINTTLYYYYHRLAHTKYFYKYIHSYHHVFIKPLPFDSLVGHPFDHLIAALLHLIPALIYQQHIFSFLVYSSLSALLGILDHSGIKIKMFKYDSVDHHIHHLYPSKNFGGSSPILILDKLHGTYKQNL